MPDTNVLREDIQHAYDDWTDDGVLEHFWGEHIHHGYYPEARHQGVDFKAAKVDLIERLLTYANVEGANNILDVGCGIGGSARYLARRLRAHVTGVTLSPGQRQRAEALNRDAGLQERVAIQIGDAHALPFDDGSFDLVWACESGEHMTDKASFFREMVRVLAPGGRLIMATWVHRERPRALTSRERRRLDAITRDWALPSFVPPSTYATLADACGVLQGIRLDDWAPWVAPTWRHQVSDALHALPYVLSRPPAVLLRSLRDYRALRAMIAGFDEGLVRYLVLAAQKTKDIL